MQFFCRVLSMAPGVCGASAHGIKAGSATSIRAQSAATISASQATDRSGIGKETTNARTTAGNLAAAATPAAAAGCSPGCCESVASCLKRKNSLLFNFVALAARLLLQQHVAPAAVALELQQSLWGCTQQQHKLHEKLALSSHPTVTEIEEQQRFLSVAAKLVQAKDFLRALSQSASECAEVAAAAAVAAARSAPAGLRTVSGTHVAATSRTAAAEGIDNLSGKGMCKENDGGSFPTDFSSWTRRVALGLHAKKAQVLRTVREALTGRSQGPPLEGLVSLMQEPLLPFVRILYAGQGDATRAFQILF